MGRKIKIELEPITTKASASFIVQELQDSSEKEEKEKPEENPKEEEK